MKNIILSLLIFVFCPFFSFAQNIHQSVLTSGGNASGTGGKVSYSVGQVVYMTKEEHEGTVSEGVQQPFEISVVTGNAYEDINLYMSAFPNPANNYLILKIENTKLEDFSYILYDLNGKLIDQRKIVETETKIITSELGRAVYLLNVIDEGITIKTFRVVKN